jgi:hypothetical protein
LEKPAVIFSEAGLKIFLEFVKGAQQKDNPVDNLVKDYFARPDRPELIPQEVEQPKPNTLYDMDAVATVVATELSSNIGTEYNSKMISVVLTEHGFEYTPKGAIAVMRGVTKRFPSVAKVGTGMYTWVDKEDDHFDEA